MVDVRSLTGRFRKSCADSRFVGSRRQRMHSAAAHDTHKKLPPARAALALPCMTRNTAARCRVMLDTRAAVKSRYGVPALARAPSLHMRHGHACCRWRSCSDLARPSRALGMPQPPHRSRALRACMQRIACLQRSSPVQVHCALAFALSTPCSRPRPHAIYLHVHPRRCPRPRLAFAFALACSHAPPPSPSSSHAPPPSPSPKPSALALRPSHAPPHRPRHRHRIYAWPSHAPFCPHPRIMPRMRPRPGMRPRPRSRPLLALALPRPRPHT